MNGCFAQNRDGNLFVVVAFDLLVGRDGGRLLPELPFEI